MTLHTFAAPAGPPVDSSVTAEAAAEEQPAVSARGVVLTDEETAALIAVLGRLAGTEPHGSDAGGTGPTDRAVQRRHRLQEDQHGLWGRPGHGSWVAAGGFR